MSNQISSGLQVSPELERRLRDAPTDDEISVAFSDLALTNPTYTKDDLRRVARELYGERARREQGQ